MKNELIEFFNTAKIEVEHMNNDQEGLRLLAESMEDVAAAIRSNNVEALRDVNLGYEKLHEIQETGGHYF